MLIYLFQDLLLYCSRLGGNWILHNLFCACLKERSTNKIEVFYRIMANDKQ